MRSDLFVSLIITTDIIRTPVILKSKKNYEQIRTCKIDINYIQIYNIEVIDCKSRFNPNALYILTSYVFACYYLIIDN